MDLAFLAPRCHRHAYAFAGVGAASGTVPTFFIGIDHVAQFAMDHPDAGDQRTDIAVNIDPEKAVMRKKSRRPFDPFTRLELKDTLGLAMDEMAERLKAQRAAITHRKFAKTDHGFTHF